MRDWWHYLKSLNAEERLELALMTLLCLNATWMLVYLIYKLVLFGLTQ